MNFFSENGKTYVVIAVISAIFIGLALYLRRIEKKIDEIGKKVNEKQK